MMWDGNGDDKQEVKETEKFDGRPEIDRRAPVELLSENLHKEQIVFVKKLQEVVPSRATTKKNDLHFADGLTVTVLDFVVGGDGAWSKIRKLLSHETPRYSGIPIVSSSLSNVKNNPWLLNYIGEGSIMSFGEDIAIIFQRGDDGCLLAYAAHVMTPFAGVGVNVGMTDALVLGREIIDACTGVKTLDKATQAYEKEMIPRAARSAQKTLNRKENHFSANGAQEFADILRSHHAA